MICFKYSILLQRKMTDTTLQKRLEDMEVNARWKFIFENLEGKSIYQVINLNDKIEALSDFYRKLYLEMDMESQDYKIEKSDPGYAELLHVYFAYNLLLGYNDRIGKLSNSYKPNLKTIMNWELRNAFHFGLINHAMYPAREKQDLSKDYLKYLADFAYSLGFHNKHVSVHTIMHELTPGIIL